MSDRLSQSLRTTSADLARVAQMKQGLHDNTPEVLALGMVAVITMRAAERIEALEGALQEMLETHSMENVGVDASMRRLNAKKRAREVLGLES